MGKRGGGRNSGGYEDQYGGGWSGGHRDHFSGVGGSSGGGGGGTGGGDAGKRTGAQVQYQRQLPKFLQAHAHLLGGETFQDDARKAWEDYAHSDQLAKYGDEDDIAGTARKGLGSNAGPESNRKAEAMGNAFGLSADVEERERREQLAKEEKGKGNRAFSEKRYEDAIRHFTVCIKLEPENQVYHSNRSAAFAAKKDVSAALRDGLAAIRCSKTWVKGHIRVGAANMGLKRYTDARESYERALALAEDNEQIKASLKEAQEAEAASIKDGNIVFQGGKRKREEAAKTSAVPSGKQVKNKKLLSFDEEDE